MEVDLSSIMVDLEPTQESEPIPEPMPEPMPVPKTIIPEPSDTSARVMEIRSWILEFPEELASLKSKKLDKLKPEELEAVWRDIEIILIHKPNTKSAVGGLIMATHMVEDITSKFTPYKIQGTHRALLHPELNRELRVLCMQNKMGMNTTPAQRLAMGLISTAYEMHHINTRAEAQKIASATPPADDKFADL